MLRSDKGTDGRRYVYLNTGADNVSDVRADASATRERDALTSEIVEELRDEVHYLREQLRQELERRSAEAERYQQIVAALTTANASLGERLRTLEPPQETPLESQESPETTSEEPERAPTRPSTGEAAVATEGLSEAKPSLLWERVVVVTLSAVAVVTLSYLPWGRLLDTSSLWYVVVSAVSLTLAWIVFPAVFGYRLGRKVRRISFWRNVASGVALLALYMVLSVGVASWEAASWASNGSVMPGTETVYSVLIVVLAAVIADFVYSSAAILGNALRRRQREKLIEERPSEYPQEAAAAAQGWTPRQQAIVGLVGTIISALIGLIGTILTVLDKT
jgi:hypothetical protein